MIQMKKKKSNVWRPTKMTQEIVEKLESIFKIDWTIEEACYYAWIDRKTYYNRCEQDTEFFHKMESAKQFPFILARKTLMKWMQSKNEATSLKAWIEFLSRREPRYSNKNTEIQKPYEPDKDDEDRKILNEILKRKHEE